MNINWNKKYNTISIYTFIVFACCIIFYLIVSQISSFSGKVGEFISTIKPFIVGGVIAYVLNFILRFYENYLFSKKKFRKMKPKLKRGLGILFTYLTVFVLFCLLIYFVLPQLINSFIGLVNDVPRYLGHTTNFFDEHIKNLNIGKQYIDLAKQKWDDLVNYIIRFGTDLLPLFGNILKDTLSSIWNIIIGLIISIYILIDKERYCALSRKVAFGIFSPKVCDRVLRLAHRANNTFGRFIVGKVINSIIIGIIIFVVLAIVRMPYAILISVILGVTNIIPFFGPFFGAIPSIIIVMFVSPIKAFWLLIIILIIQQIDGNVIGPKILGESIGISAFWILFALLVAGKLLGIVGMIIGVPLFAVIYSIIKEIVEYRLQLKGLSKDTDDYK